MGFLIGIIIGLAIGAFVVYWRFQQKISQQTQELKQSRRVTEDAEKSRDARIQETVSSIRRDYQHQLHQQSEELNRQHADHIQALKRDYESRLQDAKPAPDAQTPPTSASPPEVTPEVTPEATPQYRPWAAPVQPHSSVSSQNVRDTIADMGESHRVSDIGELSKFVNHPSSEIRKQVASVMGKIADSNRGNSAVQKAIPPLGKLSQDPNPSVRQTAIESLGNMPSAKVIPFIRQALRDSDINVVKAANTEISKYKFYSSKSQSKKGVKKKSFKSTNR
ncbi:MAG: HEAT repeat domain-containing protein [Elainellaceae cyanobacterium]